MRVVPDQSRLCRRDTRCALYRPDARRAGVVPGGCGRHMLVARGKASRAAEPAYAADRFAREISGFLTLLVARSQQLIGNPLGRHHQ